MLMSLFGDVSVMGSRATGRSHRINSLILVCVAVTDVPEKSPTAKKQQSKAKVGCQGRRDAFGRRELEVERGDAYGHIFAPGGEAPGISGGGNQVSSGYSRRQRPHFGSCRRMEIEGSMTKKSTPERTLHWHDSWKMLQRVPDRRG